MKSVLISIQPYWVFLIIAKIMGWNIDKEKSVEVRKNYPKAENWDKIAKIYCSKDKKSFSKIPQKYQPFMERLLGKVIGEFVCDIVEPYWFTEADTGIEEYEDVQLSCVPVNELLDYANGEELYFWNISDLAIYDEPKPLTDFVVRECLWENIRNNGCIDASGDRCYDCRLKRPPQSWCYVEV